MLGPRAEAGATIAGPGDTDSDPNKEMIQKIVRTVRWTAAAVALRRALDVNTDDKLARAAKRGRAIARTAVTARPGP